MTEAKPRKWKYGYIRWGTKGPTYVIEQWRGGVRFHVSTRKRTEDEALKEFFRFAEDPVNYEAVRVVKKAEVRALHVTAKLVFEYRDWMLSRQRPASRDWALNCCRLLADWADDLDGIDLRDVSVQRDLKPALDRRRTCRKHRIEVIKAFATWLRREKGLLRHAEDPTLDLAVPQGTAEKTRRRKVIPEERFLAVLPHIPPDVRDVALLQSATAFHVSECSRFAQSGELVRNAAGPYLAVVMVKHKNGELVPTPLQYPEHVEAAERLLKRGRIPNRHQLADALTLACIKAGVPRFGLGVMRHSVLTWAYGRGASMSDLAKFAHHKSERTTATFYVDLAVAPVAVPVVRPLALVKGGKG